MSQSRCLSASALTIWRSLTTRARESDGIVSLKTGQPISALPENLDLLRSCQAGYSVGVSRRIFQCVAAMVLFFATLTPLPNCFDTWDKDPPANDTELHLTALFAGVGFVLVLPKLVRRFLIPEIRAQLTAFPSCLGMALFCSGLARPDPTASPPLTPLRI
jgi:hypothetical protein